MNKWLVLGTSIIMVLLTLSLVSAAVPTPEEIQAMRSKSLETTAEQLTEIAEKDPAAPDSSLLEDAVSYLERADSVSGTSEHVKDIEELQKKIDSIPGGAPPAGGGPPPPSGSTTSPAKPEHKLQLTDVKLDPDTVECKRETTLSFKINNIGGFDEPEVIVSYSKNELSIDYSDDYSLTSKEGKDGSHSFTVPKEVADGEYPIRVEAFYNTDEFSDAKIVTLTVKSCGWVDRTLDYVVADSWSGKGLEIAVIVIVLFFFVDKLLVNRKKKIHNKRLNETEALKATWGIDAATAATEEVMGGDRGTRAEGGSHSPRDAPPTFDLSELIGQYRQICDQIDEIFRDVREETQGIYDPRKREKDGFVSQLKNLMSFAKDVHKDCGSLSKEEHPVRFFNDLSDERNGAIDTLRRYADFFEGITEDAYTADATAMKQILDTAIQHLSAIEIPPPSLEYRDESDDRGKRTWRRLGWRTTPEPFDQRNERAKQAMVTNNINRSIAILIHLEEVVMQQIRSHITDENRELVTAVLQSRTDDEFEDAKTQFASNFFSDVFNLSWNTPLSIRRLNNRRLTTDPAFLRGLLSNPSDDGIIDLLSDSRRQISTHISEDRAYGITPAESASLNRIQSELGNAIHALHEILRELGRAADGGSPGDSRRHPDPSEPEWRDHPAGAPRPAPLPRAPRPDPPTIMPPRIVRVNGGPFDPRAEYIAIVGEDSKLKADFTVEIDAGDSSVIKLIGLQCNHDMRGDWFINDPYPYWGRNSGYMLNDLISRQFIRHREGLLQVKFQAITSDDPDNISQDQESEDSAILKIRIEKEGGAPSAPAGSSSAEGSAVGGSGEVIRGGISQLSILLIENNVPLELLAIEAVDRLIYNGTTHELIINYNGETTREIEGRIITIAPIVRGRLQSNSLDNIEGMKIRRPMSSPSSVREIKRTGEFSAKIIADDSDYEIDLLKLGYRP